MSIYKRLLTVFLIGVVAACVTINVYFPEAAAEQAATQFISGVLSDDAATESATDDSQTPQTSMRQLDWLMLLPIAPAYAQQDINVDINTPAIRAIQTRMRQRLQNELKVYFDAGAIGFGNDGLLKIKDRAAVGLSERSKLDRVVTADNQDRTAVYREIAVANGHPEWEDDIRRIFANEWVTQAASGWYYENSAGDWVQK